jgi:hypothetical protein
MATWTFYSDAGLSNTVTGLDCTATTTTHIFWFGSATTGRQLLSQTTGGSIALTPTDSATGGHATTAIKLSSTSGGLSGATPGAALSLATSIQGGAANAHKIWCEITDAVGSGVLSTELSLALTDCWEAAT